MASGRSGKVDHLAAADQAHARRRRWHRRRFAAADRALAKSSQSPEMHVNCAVFAEVVEQMFSQRPDAPDNPAVYFFCVVESALRRRHTNALAGEHTLM